MPGPAPADGPRTAASPGTPETEQGAAEPEDTERPDPIGERTPSTGGAPVPPDAATGQEPSSEHEPIDDSDVAVEDPDDEEVTFGASATVLRMPRLGSALLDDTGSRMGIPVEELPATVHRVTVDDARTRGAHDVNSALYLLPGVTPVFRYGGFQQIRARGFQAIVLNDGRRDNRATFVNSHPQGGLWDLERIEVLSGPSAVLYGYGSVGGVVNLIRRLPSEDTAYVADLAIGTPRQWQAHLGATGTIVDGLTYRVDAGHTAHTDYRDFGTRRTQGTLTLLYQPAAAHRVMLRTGVYRDHYDTDSGIPTTLRADGTRGLPENAVLSNRYNTPQDGLDYARWDVEAAYEWDIAPGLRLRERFSFARDEYEYFSTEGLAYNDSGPTPMVDRTYYFYFFHHWAPISNQVELLADFETGPVQHRVLTAYEFTGLRNARSDRASNIFDYTIPSVDLRHPVETAPEVPILRDSAFVASMRAHSVFAQDHLTLPANFHAIVGARVDVFDFDSRRDRFDPATDERTSRGPTDARHSVGLTYRAGLVNRPVPWLVMHAGWSTGYEPNARLGLQGAITDDDGNTIGFRQVRPELSEQFEGGLRILAGDTRLDAAGYWIRKRNVTYTREMDRVDTAGEVHSRGLEAELRTRYRFVSLQLSYAFTDARFVVFRDTEGNDLSGRHPTFVARHTGTLWVQATPMDGLGVGVGGRFMGRQFADNENQLPLQAYALMNLAAWYEVSGVRFELSCNNLLDKRAYMVSSIDQNLTPGASREIMLRVRVTR
ncbi:MAG: TonB-dependent receptor [Polyangiales bacterium]